MAIRIDGDNATATPGITGGDADTGLVFGTDEVKIVTGGTDRVTVDSTGGLDAGAFTVDGSAPADSVNIDSSGRLLVGTSSSSANCIAAFEASSDSNTGAAILNLQRGQDHSNIGTETVVGRIDFTDNAANVFSRIEGAKNGTSGSGDYPGKLVFSTTADGASSPTERMRIGSNNSVDIGANATASDNTILTVGNFTRRGTFLGKAPSVGHTGASLLTNNVDGVGTTVTITYGGNATFAGALSKGSGSFKISHPLLEKTKTHYLYHSFIEGPQADLIYRGHVQLVDGTISVNIDEAARMTEGTFEALCTNVCCFTSNESDWTAVRGSVSGNILTIEAQDPASTADVCWMVVGERKDQHMLDTDWTDENGRVITERLKSEVDLPEGV